mmetsp:Transcript_17286/g.56539  ORF Transcript_17286/g.56539 Transcript_17286/m.56539 type:complete len:361 (-) Transcript_17286:771-1853(-)
MVGRAVEQRQPRRRAGDDTGVGGPPPVEAADEAGQDEKPPQLLSDGQRVAQLDKLVVDQSEVLLDAGALLKRHRAVGLHVAAVGIDEVPRQVEVVREEVGLRVVAGLILPHHCLAQPVALALRAAVLEGGVHHVRRGVHQVRHPRHEVRVARGEERHRQHADHQVRPALCAIQLLEPRAPLIRPPVQHALLEDGAKQHLIPIVDPLEARVAPLLHELQRRRPQEDVADVEGGEEARIGLETLVGISVCGDQVVGRHEHVGGGQVAEVGERVAQQEGVGVDGQAIDARLGQLEHQVHLVQAELPEVLRAPAVVVGGQPRAHEEGGNPARLETAARLIVQRPHQVVRLAEGDQMLDQCEGEV